MMKDFLRDRPGLYCIELRTANWPASVEWYRQALGLRVLVRVVDDGYALLEAGETRLALLARESAGEPSTRISFAFEVHDMTALIARLDRMGIVVKEAIDHPEQLREVNLCDPDGNRIRIFCWPNHR
jgi:catechol 2,3-dioxygenase-like lactoylglutathione lyase family enzyme